METWGSETNTVEKCYELDELARKLTIDDLPVVREALKRKEKVKKMEEAHDALDKAVDGIVEILDGLNVSVEDMDGIWRKVKGRMTPKRAEGERVTLPTCML